MIHLLVGWLTCRHPFIPIHTHTVHERKQQNSDDLSKVDFQIEALVKRVERQYHDVESKKSADELKVDPWAVCGLVVGVFV